MTSGSTLLLLATVGLLACTQPCPVDAHAATPPSPRDAPTPPLPRDSSWPAGVETSLRGAVDPASLAHLFPGAKLDRHPFADSCDGDYFSAPQGGDLFETRVDIDGSTSLSLIHTVDVEPMSTHYTVIAVAAGWTSDVQVMGLRTRESRYRDIAARFPEVVCRQSMNGNCGDHDGTVVMCAAIGTAYLFELATTIGVADDAPKVGPGGFVIDPRGVLTTIYWSPNAR